MKSTRGSVPFLAVGPGTSKPSFRRVLVFSLVPLLAILLLVELGLRVAIYQHRSQYALAMEEVYRKLQHTVRVTIASYQLGALKIPGGTREALYSKDGRKLLGEFQSRYEAEFKQLVDETAKVGSKLLVVYVPSDDYHSKRHQMDTNRTFFSQLCKKYGIAYIDMTASFLEYPSDIVTLLPADNHLSRFGNKILAREIGQAIDAYYPAYRSSIHFDERPRLLGDSRPNDNSIWTLVPSLPYRVRTNNQGLRMPYDLGFPKQKQRTLVLGDSVTFGVFLDDHDTYPSMLNEMYPDREFVNAGIQGYTVLEQLSLFVERARYVEPDITVLQVLDNDLYDFYYFRLNIFDREKRSHKPSILEQELLEKLREL